MAFAATIIYFLVSLVISSVIIYFTTKVFGETEGFTTALWAALIGALIYAIVYAVIPTGFWASLLGGIAWLLALRFLYSIGWLKSLAIAFVIWIFAALVSYALPTVVGPL